jgi:hypothetical protein
MATTLTLIIAALGGCFLLAWVLGDVLQGGEATSSADGGGPDNADGESGGGDGGGGGGDGGGD